MSFPSKKKFRPKKKKKLRGELDIESVNEGILISYGILSSVHTALQQHNNRQIIKINILLNETILKIQNKEILLFTPPWFWMLELIILYHLNVTC